MSLYAWAVVLHVFGAVIGVGAVLVHDLQLMRAIGDKDLGLAFQKSSHFFGKLIQTGLALLVISAIYFMYSKPALWGSEKILTKIGLVVILIINGFVINFIHNPRFASLQSDDWQIKTPALKKLISARLPLDVISVTTWVSVLFLGAVGRQAWGISQIAIGYVALLLLVYTVLCAILKKRLYK